MISDEDVAIVRVEQFYPFNEERMREIAERYGAAEEVVWAQEEPRNRGGWTFMYPRLLELFPKKRVLYMGRPPGASPATGLLSLHREEQEKLVAEVLGVSGSRA